MASDPREQFISEPITPAEGTFDSQAIARGEPGLPTKFTWRGNEYLIEEVLEVWKTSTPESAGGELYLRRHWWEVRTHTGHIMKLYFERQKNRKNAKDRWFIYTLVEPGNQA